MKVIVCVQGLRYILQCFFIRLTSVGYAKRHDIMRVRILKKGVVMNTFYSEMKENNALKNTLKI